MPAHLILIDFAVLIGVTDIAFIVGFSPASFYHSKYTDEVLHAYKVTDRNIFFYVLNYDEGY
jgi:hypothetical protein